MKNILIIILLAFMNISTVKSQTNIKSLKKIVTTFKEAISNDVTKEEFYNLFLYDTVTWATVPEGKTKEVLKKKSDYKPFTNKSLNVFYDFVSTNNCEEKFYNVTIDHDHNYAKISFDYSFSLDHKVINWGKEYWTLLKVDNEWKITSVLWTTNFQNIEESPFEDNSYYRQ
jgi:hypothetical protein